MSWLLSPSSATKMIPKLRRNACTRPGHYVPSIASLAEFLGTEPLSASSIRFAVGRELHGAFGGAFGGVVAACALITARAVVPGRVPIGLDVRFLRAMPAGPAVARAEVVQSGRSLSVVSVDITGADERPATRATVSLVDTAAL